MIRTIQNIDNILFLYYVQYKMITYHDRGGALGIDPAHDDVGPHQVAAEGERQAHPTRGDYLQL